MIFLEEGGRIESVEQERPSKPSLVVGAIGLPWSTEITLQVGGVQTWVPGHELSISIVIQAMLTFSFPDHPEVKPLEVPFTVVDAPHVEIVGWGRTEGLVNHYALDPVGATILNSLGPVDTQTHQARINFGVYYSRTSLRGAEGGWGVGEKDDR